MRRIIVAAAAETRMSHIVARVMAAPAAALESRSRQVRDITYRYSRHRVIDHSPTSDQSSDPTSDLSSESSPQSRKRSE